MPAKVQRISVSCPNCEATFQTIESRQRQGRGKFCSKKCSAKTNSTKHGHSTHSSHSATYSSWCAMLQRCENPNPSKYPAYGGLGITVCEAWHDFANFLQDMGQRPAKCTLDRVNGALGYSKGNCRWATPSQQQANLKSNVWVEYEGKQWILNALAKHLNIDAMTLKYRIRRWPKEKWPLPTKKNIKPSPCSFA